MSDQPHDHPTVALALGGGGARGLAHVGVIEVLMDAGVTISHIVGTSVGSVVGAAYAFDPDIRRMTARALRYLLSPRFQTYIAGLNSSQSHEDADLGEPTSNWYTRLRDYVRANRYFHRMIMSNSMVPGRVLETVINSLLPDADLSESRIPLTITAVDLVSGREVELTKGPLRLAAIGSSSLPGIFPPVRYGACQLADVGVIVPVPTHAARRTGCAKVIAVDVTQFPQHRDEFASAVDVLIRLEDIAGTIFLERILAEADVVIHPAVGNIEWTDFSTVEVSIEAGRVAARQALPAVRAALGLSEDSRARDEPAPAADLTLRD